MKKTILLLYILACFISGEATAAKVIWNLKTKYDISQSGFASIISDAKDRLKNMPNDTIIILIDAGTYNIGGNGKEGILVDDIGMVNATGRIIFKGAGMDFTTLVFTDISQDMIHGSDVYGLEFKDMHCTRNRYTVTQGNVVSVGVGEIDLELHQGFPTPLDLWNNWTQGRFLRRYTTSETDPQIIQTDNSQVPYGYVNKTYKQPQLISERRWRFFLNNSEQVLSNYKVGDLVGVKSKFEGEIYWFQRGKNLVFENFKWTHSSRGLVRGGFSNVYLKGCRIERAAAIQGQTPCMSTPSGGPQMNQYASSGDAVSTDMVVENCFIDSPGDDCVAFFNVNGAKIINSTFRNSFARGIMVSQDAYNVCVSGTTVENSLISLEDNVANAPNLRTPFSTFDINEAYKAGFITNCNLTAVPNVKKSDDNQFAFSIFPNPTGANLNIRLSRPDNFVSVIVNLHGIVHIISTNNFSVDVSNLSKGMYLLLITQNGQRYIKKFIKS